MEKKEKTMKKIVKNSKPKTVKYPTLLEAIEKVVELAEDSKLNDRLFVEVAPEIGLLSDGFGITPLQAVLFCVCMHKGPRRVDFDDLANHLDVSKIAILKYSDDIDALIRRRLLRYRDAKEEDEFDVYQPVIKALKHNEIYEIPKNTGLDCIGLFEQLETLMDNLDNNSITAKDLYGELETLFDDNPDIDFVRKIRELDLRREDLMLLVKFCSLLINDDDDDIRFGQMEDVFESKSEFNKAKAELRSARHNLMEAKLIDHHCEDGIADTKRYKLTDSAKRNLLAEFNLQPVEEKIANILKPQELTAKEMFYPGHIEKQVDELASFFQPDQFAKIKERMQNRGFRSGFACLFYGGPGTGKTETVYQMARQTGRSVMVVDVPQIKSKWVGDSEKNIKALFDNYRAQAKRMQQAPILLFNEADAIIGKRKNGAESSVDKMENSIQNIILQEMETLDGIMIATTNLEENFDSAFERRFLYKIKFDKPDAAVRQKIWQQMIPELTDDDAKQLASTFDFSGGQIENIARKHSINMVLYGEQANLLDTLMEYGAAEKISSKRVCNRIGF